MKMISPAATSTEIPRSTSMRREPILKDWNKSRATSCVCCTGQLLRQDRHVATLALRLAASQCQCGSDLGQKKSPRKKFRGDLRFCPKLSLRHAERFQRWLVHRARWFEALRGLIFRQRRAGLRSEDAVDVALIKSLLLQRGLDVGYDLARILSRIRGVDRSIIIIDRVRCITPRRVPVGTVPVIPAT